MGGALRPGALLADFERSRAAPPAPELSPSDQVAVYLQEKHGICRLTALRLMREFRGELGGRPLGPITSIDDDRLQTGIRHLIRTGQL